MKTVWISFAAPTGHLGVLVTRINEPDELTEKFMEHAPEPVPGYDAQAVVLADEQDDRVNEEYYDRLLTPDEARALVEIIGGVEVN